MSVVTGDWKKVWIQLLVKGTIQGSVNLRNLQG